MLSAVLDAARMDRRQRVNGLSRPLHPMQMLSWVLFASFVGTFYSLFFASLDTAGRIAAGIVFGACAVGTAVSAGLATSTDPADPAIFETEPTEETSQLYCYSCQRHVREASKHCTVCHKCIDVFDRESRPAPRAGEHSTAESTARAVASPR